MILIQVQGLSVSELENSQSMRWFKNAMLRAFEKLSQPKIKVDTIYFTFNVDASLPLSYMGLVWIRVWLVDEAETTCEVKNRLAQLMGEQFRSILGYQERKVVVIVGEGFDPLKDGFCKLM